MNRLLKTIYLGLSVSLTLVVFSLFSLISLSPNTSVRAASEDLVGQTVVANPQASSDAIAIRVLPNDHHLSAREWFYQNISAKRSLQSLTVDGYDAVRDNRTVYVATSNVAGCGTDINLGVGDCLSPVIAIISFNQNISTETVDIFGQILNNWKFNQNLNNRPKTCSDNVTSCSRDEECRSQGSLCSSLKEKVIRDTKRLITLASIKTKLENYRLKYQHYPNLEAGSYLPNKTLSVWPSWQKTLAAKLGSALPVDPVNKMGACTGDGVNPTTCWNEQTKRFYDDRGLDRLPSGSLVMRYEFVNNSQYNLCAQFETSYANITTSQNNCTDSSLNKGPIINCRNIVGLPGKPFTGYAEVSDREGDLITSATINPTSLTGWDPITVSLTPDRRYVKIISNRAGGINRYNIALTVKDSLNNATTVDCPITIGGNRFSLSYSAGAGGSISGTLNQIVDQGGSGTQVTAVPAAGKHFVKWSDNNSATAQRTDTNVSSNIATTAIFETNPSYTLTLNPNGGNSLDTSSISVTQGLPIGTLPIPTRSGYAFGGWNTLANGSGTTYTASTVYTNNGNLTLYAKWSRNSFTLTYTAGVGGTISGTNPQTVSINGNGTQVTAQANGLYSFFKWSDGRTGANRTDTNVTQDISVTAIFTQNNWQCGTDFLDIRDNKVYQTVAINGQCWLKQNLKWFPASGINAYLSLSNTDPRYYVYNFYIASNDASQINSNANFIQYGIAYNWPAAQSACPAGWTLPSNEEYTALANSLGGASSAGQKMKPVQTPSATCTAVGNNSSGFSAQYGGFKSAYDTTSWSNTGGTADYWTSSVSGSNGRRIYLDKCSSNALGFSNDGKAGGKYVRCVKPITYTITYTAGPNGSITGSTTQNINHGGSGTQVTATPATGYKFKNWSDSYTTSAQRTDTNVTANKSVTANFEPIAPPVVDRIIFDGQGGDVRLNGSPLTNNSKSVTTNTRVGDLPTATKGTSVFNGWYTGRDGQGDKYTTETIFRGGEVTLFAYWTEPEPERVTVTFYHNNGSGQQEVIELEKGASIQTLPANPVREGYTFTGWYEHPTNESAIKINGTPWGPITYNLSYYARWEVAAPNRYTVTFDKNGGMTEANPATIAVNIGATVGTLPTPPTRSHYTFTGWKTAPDGGTVFTTSTAVTANITVYAQWTPQQYTVIFDDNFDGGSSASRENISYLSKINPLPEPIGRRDNYYFNGWNTQTDGMGSDFTVDTQVIGNITLYAKWAVQPMLTVTFNANYSGGGIQTRQVYEGNKVNPLPPFTRGCYDFLSWNTTTDGSGTAFTVDTVVNADITVYAQWRIRKVTVTFNDNFEGGGIQTKEFNCGDAIGTLPQPTKTRGEAYYFSGWNTQSNGMGVGFGPDHYLIQNVTLYAKWAVRPVCKVVFTWHIYSLGNYNTLDTNERVVETYCGHKINESDWESVNTEARNAFVNAPTMSDTNFLGWSSVDNHQGSYGGSNGSTVCTENNVNINKDTIYDIRTSGNTSDRDITHVYAKNKAKIYRITYVAGVGGKVVNPATLQLVQSFFTDVCNYQTPFCDICHRVSVQAFPDNQYEYSFSKWSDGYGSRFDTSRRDGINNTTLFIAGDKTVTALFENNWILVPGDSRYGTSDFRVARHETRTDYLEGGISTPCSAFGHHVMTENEWFTIARNIEQQPSNWSSGVAGIGYINSGYKRSSPGDVNNSFVDSALNFADKRTHTLSNGEVIWDFSGNMPEYTSDRIIPSNRPTIASDPNRLQPGCFEYSEITDFGTTPLNRLKPLNQNHGSANGYGKFCVAHNTSDSYQYRILRGSNVDQALVGQAGLLNAVLTERISPAPYNATRCVRNP